ncbi:histidine phosphatase family protein [Cellulomonas edaphi]|uniref:phosphoglycerate mutase (2,3-diphosphoglycerate-dependent) n=1 Tax=Cellulomonas edaphi TaxID=3053468 RepID=A0ABT7S3S7_9CELL|nr:histidine phosphatase family protein [Cellulomons edaphi]MDM7830277.1 histidine phosphatase family protein [Cellulomons edaphi]
MSAERGAVELVLVRHGESVGNLAAAAAAQAGADRLELDTRDADTPLSARGLEQARALGEWLGALPPDERPDVLWCSPYDRARQTAETALATAGFDVPRRIDERLRDRELGITDRLTTSGIARLLPEEAARRALLGKFYYRPPGGESWADVALRLRSVLADVDRREDGRCVLVVTHDAVIALVRYVLEDLTETQLFDLVRERSVRNASVTILTRGGDAWTTSRFDDVAHLAALDAPVTEHEGTDPHE